MNDMIPFQYEDKQVRTIERDGEPWFVAKDICDVLEIGNHRDAMSRLPETMKGVATTDTLGGPQQVTIISEAGMYKLAFTSRKEEAERFTDWVASEVLPSIRKHGVYATPATAEAMMNDPDVMIRLFSQIKAERLEKEQLKIESAQKDLALETQRPKVIFADAVSVSNSSILVGDLAKIIKQNGHDMGQKRLFEWLRVNNYLIKGGASKNMPTQRSMDQELFEVKESTISNPDGSVRITKTTKVTGKGQIYFINKFCGTQMTA